MRRGQRHVVGFVGGDTVDGGDDTDTITLDATSGDLNAATDLQIVNVEKIDASSATGPGGVVIDLGVQTDAAGFTITGSGFADTITGSQAADTIYGGIGADTIDGRSRGGHDLCRRGQRHDCRFCRR